MTDFFSHVGINRVNKKINQKILLVRLVVYLLDWGGLLVGLVVLVKHPPTNSSTFAPESHDATGRKTKTMVSFPFGLNCQFSRAIC